MFEDNQQANCTSCVININIAMANRLMHSAGQFRDNEVTVSLDRYFPMPQEHLRIAVRNSYFTGYSLGN